MAVTATRLCRVWLSGSLDCPLKKMIMAKTDRMKNTDEQIAISEKRRLAMSLVNIRYPRIRMMIWRIRRKEIFLIRGFNSTSIF